MGIEVRADFYERSSTKGFVCSWSSDSSGLRVKGLRFVQVFGVCSSIDTYICTKDASCGHPNAP